MSVSDEAVEAAARAMHVRAYTEAFAWESLSGEQQEGYRAEARSALEAAATSIASQALRDAASALEQQPPMIRDRYVSTLRLYAKEPWRLNGGDDL